MTDLRTDAWLLRGIGSIPGELKLTSGTLAFEAFGTGSAWPFQLRKLQHLLSQPQLAQSLEQGNSIQLFSWPARDVSCVLPWYYFGGGMKLQHDGVELRFSFGRPSSGGQSLAQAGTELQEVGTMRARGKLWAAALAKAI
jgi:hypothetical protein